MTSTEADRFWLELIEMYPDWLSPSKRDKDYAYCRLCKCTLKISTAPKFALSIHDKTKKHARNVEAFIEKSTSSANVEPAPRILLRKLHKDRLASLSSKQKKHAKNKWHSKLMKKYKYNARFPNKLKSLRVSLDKDCFMYPGSHTYAEEGEKYSDKNDSPSSVEIDDDSLVHPSVFLKEYPCDNHTNPEKGKTFFEADSPSFFSFKVEAYENAAENNSSTICEPADQSSAPVPPYSSPDIIFGESSRPNNLETDEQPLLSVISDLVNHLRAFKVQFDADCHRILKEINEFLKETSIYNVNFGEFEFLKTIFDQPPNFSTVPMLLMCVSIPASAGEEENASGSSVSNKAKEFLDELRLVKVNFDSTCSNILQQLDELMRKSPASYGEFEFLKPLMEKKDFKCHFLLKMFSDIKDK